ncbi:hypothetical protein [Microbacterium sp. XT11]|uniref:hypothetical protein n=1 Tax=Microbacterium sp. XT11 TaxID=367477 RepID=UPI000742E135|nr:hypothetical protein [Microbacterium sp. XT11]ALX65551.1 hypothetical protein AB663_000071 [Microbacterium sp. XT11]
MPSRPLDPDTHLGVRLSAIMARHAYTKHPEAVVDELYRIAGERLDILAEEVGVWIGFHESEHTRDLTAALRRLPLDLDAWIETGRERRRAGHHSTTGFMGPNGTGR